MLKRSIFGALAALAIAGGSLAASAGTASAAQFGLYIGAPGPYYGYGPYYYAPTPAPSCWRWSYYGHRWVWACGPYGYYHHHHHDYD
jgi:hypothetical protein